jgi:hypothetical protein
MTEPTAEAGQEWPTVWHCMLVYRDTRGRLRLVGRGAPAEDIPPDARQRAEELGAFDPPEEQGKREPSLVQTLPPLAGVQELEPVPAVTTSEAVPAAPEGAAGRPARVAPKAAWVEYAVSRGVDRVEAEDMTKEELVTDPRLA